MRPTRVFLTFSSLIFAPGMKKTIPLLLVIPACLFFACNSANNKTQQANAKQFPKPGTIIASVEMPVTEDTLNHFTFSVKIIADSNVASGVYDVDADFGNNFAEGQLTMPKGGENLKPIIRKGDAPYTYIIGFKVAGDTTFYDYFQVSSNNNTTKMEYIKGYTFTTE